MKSYSAIREHAMGVAEALAPLDNAVLDPEQDSGHELEQHSDHSCGKNTLLEYEKKMEKFMNILFL